jgi:D-beta-D-heptose 7-phosphate kinase/D-beta-D-heptose 1-phosphate adenosyltransferase
MSLHFDAARLRRAVNDFVQAQVLVLGDVMLDQFIWGRVRRISPEAPVPVVEVESETYMLGGAANVLHNLIALGGRATLAGLVGRDEAGQRVLELLDDLEVPAEGIVVCPDRPTTVKTRVVAHSQQVVRVDREWRRAAEEEETQRLAAFLERQVPQVQAVVVSDYAKGVVTAPLMARLMELARQHDCIVAVDPKVVNMELFAGATVVTPNHLEAAAATGVDPEDPDHVRLAGRRLLERLRPRCVLVTQGQEGMTVFTPEEETHIPTVAKRVFDVTGAGDTVVSTLTLGLVAGLEPAEAAALANLAAGLVVGEVGTSAVTAGRLLQVVEEGVHLLNHRKA